MEAGIQPTNMGGIGMPRFSRRRAALSTVSVSVAYVTINFCAYSRDADAVARVLGTK